MDDKIQVCAVFVDGYVRIYGLPQDGQRKPVGRGKFFRSYGAAIQFAQKFEARERGELIRKKKK